MLVSASDTVTQRDELGACVAHRYYVRPCSKPPKRAAIALAVKVGSVVEDEEARGVAHILEHLVQGLLHAV